MKPAGGSGTTGGPYKEGWTWREALGAPYGGVPCLASISPPVLGGAGSREWRGEPKVKKHASYKGPPDRGDSVLGKVT